MTYEEFKEKVGSVILTDEGNCPVTPVVQMLQGKWKLQILYELCIKCPMRFGELKKVLKPMSFLTTVLYSAVGLVVFMLLTAYDTQKLSQMFSYYAYDGELAEKASIYGALTLYLDFINIFQIGRAHV